MSQSRFLPFFALFLASAPLFAQTSTSNPAVRFHTNLGDIDVILTPDVAPLTVANFLSYVDKGAYTNSIFHRSVPGFIIQAGGYQLQDHMIVATPQDAPVKNEFNVTNSRGTIAMAKLGSDPNSATNQWFFNLVNNGANLDNQNGGFTVFGKFANAASLAVIDKIAAQSVHNFGSPFDALPLFSYLNGAVVQDANYVQVKSIVPLPFVILASVDSGASYAPSSTNGISPGEILTVFGTAIGPSDLARGMFGSNGALTSSLSGTRVLFDGTAAPLLYTSSGQIGLIAPQNLAGKSSVNVVVEYQSVQTAAVSFPVVATNPGIFTLNASGSGDGIIFRPDGTLIDTQNPGQSGEILVLYAEGYGAASSAAADGTIVGSTLPVPLAPISLYIDGQKVDTLYAGGAPGVVSGVLQINFKVPTLTAGSHQIQVQAGDRKSPSGVNLQTK